MHEDGVCWVVKETDDDFMYSVKFRKCAVKVCTAGSGIGYKAALACPANKETHG